MFTEQKFIGFFPMRAVFPTVLHEATGVSIDLTAALASEYGPFLLAADDRSARRRNLLERTNGEYTVE